LTLPFQPLGQRRGLNADDLANMRILHDLAI
jgi:hypothetical protein